MPLAISARLAGLTAATIALTACSDQPANSPASPSPTDSAAAQPIALGLTLYQLAGADLIGAYGEDLGEVERVVRDQVGRVTGLIIEIEDSNPDRFVQIPLDGLSSVRKGDDWDLQSDLTRDQLAGLPDANPQT